MKNIKSKVSIIIPAFNVEKYIFRGIESVINQTYNNIELIIVDDGSTDNTLNIVKEYSNKDHRIKVYSQKNKGVSSARNEALKHVSGDYLLFLDSDDWLVDDAVEKLINIQQKNDNYLVCCDRYFAYIKGDKIEVENQAKTNCIKKLSKIQSLLEIGTGMYNLQSSCYKLYSKNIIEKKSLKFDETLYHGEDGLFTFQYVNAVDGIVYIPEALWVILERPNSATTGKFNHKWLTAIDSVNKMINECDNDEVLQKLKKYLYLRTCYCMLNYLKSDYSNDKDFNYLRLCLKQNYSNCNHYDINIKNKIIYIMYITFPESILKILCKICIKIFKKDK